MLYVILVLIIIFGEWKLKNYIDNHYDTNTSIPILKHKILLRKYHNEGAFLNVMEKKKKLLHILSVLFTLCIFLCFFLTLGQKGNKFLKLGLSLLLGGAFSNTYDRLKRKYVVDYFSFCTPYPKLNRIVFNLSDFCIIIGALIMALTY